MVSPVVRDSCFRSASALLKALAFLRSSFLPTSMIIIALSSKSMVKPSLSMSLLMFCIRFLHFCMSFWICTCPATHTTAVKHIWWNSALRHLSLLSWRFWLSDFSGCFFWNPAAFRCPFFLLPPRGRAPPNKPYRCLERFPDRNCCNSMIKLITTEIMQQCAEISVSRTFIFWVELALRVIGAMPTRMLAYIQVFQIVDLPGGRTYGTSHRSFFWKKTKNSCYSGYL